MIAARCRRQLSEAMRLELRRILTPWGALRLLLMALAPALIILAHVLHDATGCSLEEETVILGVIVQVYFVRMAVFFGCLGIFTRLVRGELAEHTLHYAFLAPVRRELLVAGRFLAGVLTACLVFGFGVAASFFAMYLHSAAGRELVRSGPGASQLAAYLLVAALACLGYGAVFLALSLIFRNPIVPSVVVFFWEAINGALPVWLKLWSVTFYLKPLFPVELPVEGVSGLFTVVAEPVPGWLAVTGLGCFALAVLVFACWRVRRLEVLYSID